MYMYIYIYIYRVQGLGFLVLGGECLGASSPGKSLSAGSGDRMAHPWTGFRV